jgi:hypothetical protein
VCNECLETEGEGTDNGLSAKEEGMSQFVGSFLLLLKNNRVLERNDCDFVDWMQLG